MFEPGKPFGLEYHDQIPVDQSSMDALAIVEPLRVPIESKSSLILGRKGSGKTTIISGLEGRRLLQKRMRISESLYNGDVVLGVKVWQHFHEMVREVIREFSGGLSVLTDGLVPVEVLEEKWAMVFWEEILSEYWADYSTNTELYKTAAGQLAAQALTRYYNPPYESDLSVIGARGTVLFQEACNCVLAFMKDSHRGCLMMFDNMEQYPVRNPAFRAVIAGFLRAVNNFPRQSPGVRIVFCLPEEIEEYVSSASTTRLKDFASLYRIRWKPIDLLRVAAHRYRSFLKDVDPEFAAELSEYHLSDAKGRTDRKQVVELFERLLPAYCENSCGRRERPLPYIMRHTQLIPRHILLIFNAIASMSHTTTGGWRYFTGEAIAEALALAEREIHEEVLQQYRTLYPKFLSEFSRVLSELPPIFSNSELASVCNRFSNDIEVPKSSIENSLYQIGVIGKLDDPSTKTHAETRDTAAAAPPVPSAELATYLRAYFHFCGEPKVSFNSGSMFCFHPVFSRSLDVLNWRESCRYFIYPAQIDSFGDEDD
jgi:hypothetical protein